MTADEKSPSTFSQNLIMQTILAFQLEIYQNRRKLISRKVLNKQWHSPDHTTKIMSNEILEKINGWMLNKEAR